MIIFVLVIVVIVMNIGKGLGQWSRNNNSPVLTVESQVVAKRMDVRHYHHNHNNTSVNSSTTYYITFQVQSGDRLELVVPDEEYGLIVEGDFGNLTFQGSRFLNFIRAR